MKLKKILFYFYQYQFNIIDFGFIDFQIIGSNSINWFHGMIC